MWNVASYILVVDFESNEECYIFAEVPSVRWASPIAGIEYRMEQLIYTVMANLGHTKLISGLHVGQFSLTCVIRCNQYSARN